VAAAEVSRPAGATRAAETTQVSGAPTWSVLIDPPMCGARNMARDHALAQALQDGRGILRIYRWDRPTVSFGRNEPARGRYDLGGAARRGVHFVRRPTGGRAVLHDRELTYAVALPLRAIGGARGAYMAVNAGLVRALRSLGVPAELAASGEACATDAGPCFQRAASGEVVVSGRKLVGSAQVRVGNVLLQHGSLLLGPGQELLSELAPGARPAGDRPVCLAELLERARPPDDPPVSLSELLGRARPADDPPVCLSELLGRARPADDPPVCLSELLGREPEWDDLVEAVVDGLSRELGGGWGEPGGPTIELRSEEALLVRYASDVWTWRR
jgi:lipoate-protein ligase A